MATARRGLLVAFEGIDGSGKTTQVDGLCALLERTGVAFVRTREPTDGPFGRRIRESARTGRMSPEDEAAAFIEDRREHVRDLIAPALAEGKVVVVDRYLHSTVAYQGALGLDPDELLRRQAFAPAPDLLFIVDVPPEVGLSRVHGRGDRADLFEERENLTRVRAILQTIEGPGVHHLNGRAAPPTLAATVARVVEEALAARGR